MAVHVTREENGALKEMTFSCDAEGCETVPPLDDAIIAAGGLRNMGWHCSGGRHFCPDHHPSEETNNG